MSDRRQPTVELRRYKLADGTRQERWSVRYWDAAGRRRRTSFRTREEAEFERARLVLEQSRAVAAGPVASTSVVDELPAPTLGAFFVTWHADASSRLASSTVKDYEGVWRRRLADRFGGVPMDRIRPRDVSLWRAEMLADGLGPETVRRAMVLLQAMFTVAIEWGEVTANPVSVVRKPRQGRDRAVEPLLPEQVERLRRALLDRGDRRSATLVVAMAYAGLRPSEALALERRHIRQGTILVEQALSDGKLKRQKTGRAYRTVDLLEPLGEDLAAWLAERPDNPEALLFPRSDGEHWRTDDWNNWRHRAFDPAARAAGLRRPRPYDLRHSFASLLIREQRTSIVDLADQLGHAPTMTLDTYSHVFREHRRAEPVDVAAWIRRAREEADA